MSYFEILVLEALVKFGLNKSCESKDQTTCLIWLIQYNIEDKLIWAYEVGRD